MSMYADFKLWKQWPRLPSPAQLKSHRGGLEYSTQLASNERIAGQLLLSATDQLLQFFGVPSAYHRDV